MKLIIIFSLYFIIGIYKVVSDFRLRIIDRPFYTRDPKIGFILLIIIAWPIFLIIKIKIFGIKRVYQDKLRMYHKRKQAKYERVFRRIISGDSSILFSNKYNRASKEFKEENERNKKRGY